MNSDSLYSGYFRLSVRYRKQTVSETRRGQSGVSVVGVGG